MIFSIKKKIGFLDILGPPSYGIGATIRIGREMLCLPYAVFFLIMLITTGYMKWPKINKKTVFFCQKGQQKALVKGQGPLQELVERRLSGIYLLVSILKQEFLNCRYLYCTGKKLKLFSWKDTIQLDWMLFERDLICLSHRFRKLEQDRLLYILDSSSSKIRFLVHWYKCLT